MLTGTIDVLHVTLAAGGFIAGILTTCIITRINRPIITVTRP